MSETGSITPSYFLDKFSRTFSLYSYGNLYYGKLASHVLLGQVVKNCKIYAGPIYIDPRISIFIISPSATGKSTPWGFVADVGTQAGLKVGDIDEATDSGLIGHFDDVERIDPETGTKVVEHVKVYGKLYEGELLHYDEGKFLIERKPMALNALTWFQKALNPIGSAQNRCVKTMRDGDSLNGRSKTETDYCCCKME